LNIFELSDLAELKAIDAKLSPTEDSIWRSIERQYSAKFFTPLHQVSEIDPLFVLQALFESKFDSLSLSEDGDLNSFLDRLYTIHDPNYDAEAEKAELEYNRKAEIEEEERLARIAAKKKKKQKNTSDKKSPIDQKNGGVDLSYLAALADSEG